MRFLLRAFPLRVRESDKLRHLEQQEIEQARVDPFVL